MQKITPFLWFNNQAEEAANFYVSIFPNSSIQNILRHGKAGSGPEGEVLAVDFTLNGDRFTALNGNPGFSFTEASSYLIHCKTQEEIDHYWYKLTEGGEESMCGWLKDKYGVSWQVAPDALLEMIKDNNSERATRAMQAMMTMKKINLGKLEEAYGS